MPGRSLARIAIGLLLAGSIATSAHATNLVVNGDFEAGNSGFESDYAFSPSSNTTEAQYTIAASPYPWNNLFISAGDHTSGSGLMFVGNGSPTDGAVVWQSQPIAVTPDTNYFFEAFVMNVCCSSPFPGNSASVLEFSVSGSTVESLGIATTDLAQAGTWEGLSKQWNSGTNTLVVLSLINRNTAAAGNDFAIDDVHFGTTSVVPEPRVGMLAIAGLSGLALARSRRRVQAARA